MQKASAKRVLRGLYPPLCVACGERVDEERSFCAQCWKEVRWQSGARCPRCAMPLSGEVSTLPCDSCLASPPPWQAARVWAEYGGVVSSLVVALKGARRTELAASFGHWLRPSLEALSPDFVVPVPLHWTRLLQRGFNQSALIARQLDWPVLVDALQRVRRTPRLEGLGKEAREAQMQGAIRPHPSRSQVAGRKIALLDDVLTSGATARACTEALLLAGAAEVSVLALARVGKEP